MPNDTTLAKVFDNFDLMRGGEPFLNGICNIARGGLRDIGIDTCNKVCLFALRMQQCRVIHEPPHNSAGGSPHANHPLGMRQRLGTAATFQMP